MHFYVCLFSLLLILSSQAKALTACLSVQNSSSKDSAYVVIGEILITGNDKTNPGIILRECSFSKGDTLPAPQFQDLITRSKNRVFNTGLFITVDFHLIHRSPTYKDVLIVVKERWYIYPLPIFELADRNFNEWWTDRNRDIKRINVGINYIHKNVRGRNETLRAKVQFGFTKKFEIFYFIPYLNRKQRTGLNLEASYILNKQIAYKTSGHKLVYGDFDRLVRERFRTGLNFIYRKQFYQTHFAGVTFHYNTIADTIAELNPAYLLHGKTSQRYFSIRYAFVKDVRDVAYYPLKGSYFKAEAEKNGIGIWRDLNQLNLLGEYHLFRPLGKKFYFAGQLKQKVSWGKQPYLQLRALGYDKDYVSGYELFVIDGPHFSLGKLQLKYQLFASKKEVGAVPVEQFESIPFALYLKIYADAGYVADHSFNPENLRLSNKFFDGRRYRA